MQENAKNKHIPGGIMVKKPTIHKLRLVAGYALIGSVLTGAALGWMPTAFDWRIVGASFGAIAGFAISHREKSSASS